jgi:hypothetical protein
MGCLNMASGIGQMWRPESERKPDPKGALMKMSFMAERQVNMGYLTPYMLAVLDTRLYCAVRGGSTTHSAPEVQKERLPTSLWLTWHTMHSC